MGKRRSVFPRKPETRHPDLPWKEMIGMRNFLIHDYDDIDIHIVWSTVTKDLPDLLSKMERAGIAEFYDP